MVKILTSPVQGDVPFGGHKATGLADPTAAQDASTKAYVDAVAQGLSVKASVRAASTANIASQSGLLTVDGVTLVDGDRVLAKDQTTGSTNGIWVAHSGAWTRAADADAAAELVGAFVFVEEGATNAGSGWVQTAAAPITVGTTTLTWTQFSGAGQIVAGAGLAKAGNTLRRSASATGYANLAALPSAAANNGLLERTADGGIYESDGSAWQPVRDPSGTYVAAGADRVSVKDSNLSTHAVGDGVTDDTAAFVAARTAAGINGRVYVPMGTYLVSGVVLGLAGQTWQLHEQATIKLKSGSGNNALSVTANNVTVIGGIVDGNKSGAVGTPHGIYWTGTGGVLRQTVVQNSKNCGVLVDLGGVLDCYDVTCTAATNDGFNAKASSVLRLHGGCVGTANARHGCFLQSTASDGCRVEGTFNANGTTNGHAGVYVASQNGEMGKVRADFCAGYGVVFDTVTGWDVGRIAAYDTGLASGNTFMGGTNNNAATGVELFGCDHVRVGEVVAVRPLGYGLAISKNTGNVGTSYCDFAYVTVDHTSAVDKDPGIHIGEASHHNTIGMGAVRESTVGLIFGEGTTGNDYNRVGILMASKVDQAAVRIDGGVGNTIETVIARDIQCNNATYKGVVSFTTANATDNVVNFLDYQDTGLGVANPPYIAYADANAVRNEVRDGKARNFATGIALDSNGGNSLFPKRTRRPQQAGLSNLIIPGVEIFNVSTDALAANTLYYFPCEVEGQALAIATMWFEVTAAPASNAHVRQGLYRADANLQPVGAPVLDIETAVPTSGGAAVYNTAAAVTLLPGAYLLAVMIDQAMTFRVMLGGGKQVGCATSLGATPFSSRLSVANTYGAMPTTPVLWTTVTAGASPSRCPLLVRATAT